ncbi:MAG: nicotinate (nicotinamide) nucleotide adenylyltransferase [Mariniphaga sp.]
MRIAIFSGSFNPIHNGHLAIAREVLKQGAADELWFLVSPQNPLKKNSDLMDEKMRLKMVELAIEDEPGMKASDFEFHLPRPSYTIRTLENLRIANPQHQFTLLIGGDNLSIIHKWVEYRRIIAEFGLIVYPRPGFMNQESLLFSNTTFVTAPLIDISATEIREKLKNGEDITGMVPGKVALFLKGAKGQ